MELKHNKTTLDIVKSLNRLLLVGFMTMSVVAISMSGLTWHFAKRQLHTLVPPVINQQMSVSAVMPDESYLGQMGLFLLTQFLNVTPANIDANHAVLLRYVNSAHYGAISAMLTKEADFVKKHETSAVFYALAPEISVEKLQIKIPGTLKKWTGKRLVVSEEQVYRLQFSYTNGVLQLESIDHFIKEED